MEKETMSEKTTIEFSLVSLYNKPLNFAITPVPAAFEWLKTMFQNYIWFARRTPEEETSVSQINQSLKLDIWKLTESITVEFIYLLYFDIASEDYSKKMSHLQKATTRNLSKMKTRVFSTTDGFWWKGCTTPFGVPAPSPSLHTFLSEFSSLWLSRFSSKPGAQGVVTDFLFIAVASSPRPISWDDNKGPGGILCPYVYLCKNSSHRTLLIFIFSDCCPGDWVIGEVKSKSEWRLAYMQI